MLKGDAFVCSPQYIYLHMRVVEAFVSRCVKVCTCACICAEQPEVNVTCFLQWLYTSVFEPGSLIESRMLFFFISLAPLSPLPFMPSPLPTQLHVAYRRSSLPCHFPGYIMLMHTSSPEYSPHRLSQPTSPLTLITWLPTTLGSPHCGGDACCP